VSKKQLLGDNYVIPCDTYGMTSYASHAVNDVSAPSGIGSLQQAVNSIKNRILD